MAVPLKKPVDLLDYLEFDDASQGRHEFEGGTVYAMTGGTLRHNRLAFNIARQLADRLDGSAWQIFINDVKLHVQAADSVYYPDVFVFCGSNLANEDKLVTDAKLVVEVLSDSTAARDRRQKRVAYQKLPGLQAYWIVSQTEQRVEVHSRDAQGQWQARAYGLEDAIATDWLGESPIELARIYAGTDIAA
jgi:Uma2 family endonuclease